MSNATECFSNTEVAAIADVEVTKSGCTLFKCLIDSSHETLKLGEPEPGRLTTDDDEIPSPENSIKGTKNDGRYFIPYRQYYDYKRK